MALRELQSVLGRMVMDHAAGARQGSETLAALDTSALDVRERAWLEAVSFSPGFALTCFIQRWWREARLRTGASLTLAALGDAREATVREFVRDAPCASLFAAAESVAFLQHVEATGVGPHVRAVAALERSLWRVKQEVDAGHAPRSDAPPSSDAVVTTHPAAALITFEAPVEAVLGALLSGKPLPEPRPQRFPLLVAPGLRRSCRPVSSEEAHAFTSCREPLPLHQLLEAPGVTQEAVRALWAATALCRLDAPGK